MTATLINSQKPLGPYIAGAPVATSLNVVETAGDVANGNRFTLSGHEILLAHNTDTGAHTLTITSSADTKGRSQDITAYSIAAGKIAMYSFLSGQEGWIEGDGTCHVTVDDATLKLAVLYAQR
jgi:hypothetical protein